MFDAVAAAETQPPVKIHFATGKVRKQPYQANWMNSFRFVGSKR
jgi:hypothetical protein